MKTLLSLSFYGAVHCPVFSPLLAKLISSTYPEKFLKQGSVSNFKRKLPSECMKIYLKFIQKQLLFMFKSFNILVKKKILQTPFLKSLI